MDGIENLSTFHLYSVTPPLYSCYSIPINQILMVPIPQSFSDVSPNNPLFIYLEVAEGISTFKLAFNRIVLFITLHIFIFLQPSPYALLQ